MNSPVQKPPADKAPVTRLNLSNLHVVYPPRSGAPAARAVDGVDLAVGSGEIIALAGESGCGKTTLARAVLGLQPSTSGTITLDGEPQRADRASAKAWRRRVQLVPQDPMGSLNPRHTVYQAVAEGLRVHQVTRAGSSEERDRVATALGQAGMRPPGRFFDRYPHELSGGQRQRILIAGALVLEPQVLVADEPVSSLDASVRGTILQLLLHLRDTLGLTVLVVTHDLGLAWNIADRLAVMYLGRIVEIGPTEQVLAAPEHPYTKALLSVVPEVAHLEPIVLTGEPPDPTAIPAGCRFHPRCPVLAAAAITDPENCRTIALPILPTAGNHLTACRLV
jgi:peptide/nickel transport system ATP-binding protein